MKRRDFLLESAGLAGALIPGIGLTQERPCPPPTLAVNAGTAVATACGAADAEADWQLRKSGALQATDFRDSEEGLYLMGVRPPSGPGGVYRDDIYGVALTGGKCLRIDYPKEAGSEPGTWKCFLNSDWNSLSINSPQTVGMGSTAFYVQYRVRFPSSWLVLANGTSQGKKVSIVSSNYHSNTAFEHVIQNLFNRGIVHAYRQDGNGYPSFEESYAGDYKLQNAIPSPYCLYSTKNSGLPNCYRFTPDVWMCLYMRIKVATYGGSTGNEWDLWAWKPGETGYTHLQSFRNYGVGSVGQYTNGFNGLHLLPYTTGRTSSSVDSHVLYDQVIVSLQPVACPTV